MAKSVALGDSKGHPDVSLVGFSGDLVHGDDFFMATGPQGCKPKFAGTFPGTPSLFLTQVTVQTKLDLRKYSTV